MRLEQPNATTEAAEISAAWGCLLVEADIYAILTVVPTMSSSESSRVAIYSFQLQQVTLDFGLTQIWQF